MRFTRWSESFILLSRSRRMAFFPVRNRRTHTAEQAWARMVARAAPSTPMSKIKTGSRTMFTMAPRPTVSIPVLAKP